MSRGQFDAGVNGLKHPYHYFSNIKNGSSFDFCYDFFKKNAQISLDFGTPLALVFSPLQRSSDIG